MHEDMKVVQTSLTMEEYEALREVLEKRGMTIREGLRKAALRVITEELKIDPNDPFFTGKPHVGSGLRDASTQHDKYLYGKKK